MKMLMLVCLRRILLASLFVLVSSACHGDPALDDSDTHETPTSYAQRCQEHLEGVALAVTYQGRTRHYCVFALTQQTMTRDGLDGVGTGGQSADGLDGVGTGGQAACGILDETPHTHVIESRHIGVCSDSSSLGEEESERIASGLASSGFEVGGTHHDPSELPNNHSCIKSRVCGQEDLGQDPLVLYECLAGAYIAVESCAGTCESRDGDQEDVCEQGDVPDSSVCQGDTNGLYCGETLGLDASTLFRCDDGEIKVVESCRGVCEIMPLGEHDRCSACPSLNGDYCGDGEMRERDTLYTCMEGLYTVKELCPNGCVQAEPGQNDTCASASLCSDGGYWAPEQRVSSDDVGMQRDGMSIPVELVVEQRDKFLEGNVEIRVCKFVGGSPSNFLGSPLHIFAADGADLSREFVLFDAQVSTSPASHCTQWIDLIGEEVLDELEVRLRVVSPGSSEQEWGDWCDTHDTNAGGACWSMSVLPMTRMCS